MRNKLLFKIIIVILGITLISCDKGKAPEATPHKHAEVEASTNRIKVSNEIISNLGITFQKVESGMLGTWVSVPGKLEVPPEARYTLFAPTKGRLFWHKDRLSWVQSGDLLATIESSAFSEAQQELAVATQSLALAQGKKDSDSGSQLRFRQAERKYRESIGHMAVLTGLTSEKLEQDTDGTPYWTTLKKLEVRSQGNGYFFEVAVSNGELIKEGDHLGLILDVDRFVFRGLVSPNVHSKIPLNAPIRIKINDTTTIISALKGSLPISDKQTSKVWLEASVPNESRMLIDGSPVIAYVQIKESEYEEAIISEDCIIAEKLETVIFKRDPTTPEYVIRTPVEIGNRSDTRLEILSGVLAGDEIVCNGLHQLKQLGGGNAAESGHMHADGTWHEGDE